MNHLKYAIYTAVLMVMAGLNLSGQALFTSGSTNAQGVFPPAGNLVSSTTTSLAVDMKSGTVTAFNSSGAATGSVALPGAATSGDAFPTGEFDFTTFTVPAGVTLKFLRNSLNTPITIRASGDVTIGTGTISPSATFSGPGVIRPVNLPGLRITSVGGVAVPETPSGSSGTVDVQIPAQGAPAPANPMAIVVTASGVPDGGRTSQSR